MSVPDSVPETYRLYSNRRTGKRTGMSVTCEVMPGTVGGIYRNYIPHVPVSTRSTERECTGFE